jgi:hypothetical protein
MPLMVASVTRRTGDARQALGLVSEQLFAVCPSRLEPSAVQAAGSSVTASRAAKIDE